MILLCRTYSHVRNLAMPKPLIKQQERKNLLNIVVEHLGDRERKANSESLDQVSWSVPGLYLATNAYGAYYIVIY